jgi:hypothetical protein
MNRSEDQGRRQAAEAEADRWSRETGYEPSGNQVRDEPIPASGHEERGQEAEVRNEEHAAGNLEARPTSNARRSRTASSDKRDKGE